MIRPHHCRPRVLRREAAPRARQAASAATATDIVDEASGWPDAGRRDVQPFAAQTDASRAESGVGDTREPADGAPSAVSPAVGGARRPAGNS
jgi:hypothetical protein